MNDKLKTLMQVMPNLNEIENACNIQCDYDTEVKTFVISGKIPLEFKAYFEGNNLSSSVIFENLTDELHTKQMEEIELFEKNVVVKDESYKEYLNGVLKEKKDEIENAFSKRMPKVKYYTSCKIKTIRELVVFLTSISEFNNKSIILSNKEEKDMMAKITELRVQKYNIDMPTSKWCSKNKIPYDDISIGNISVDLRKKLEEYDESVNPYLNRLDMKDANLYLDYIEVEVGPYNDVKTLGDETKDNASLSIKVKNSKLNQGTQYYRTTNAISYQSVFQLEDGTTWIAEHEIGKEGEIFRIGYLNKEDSNESYQLTYLLSDDTISITSSAKEEGTKQKVSLEQYDYFCVELQKVIELAAAVTIKNMLEPNNI